MEKIDLSSLNSSDVVTLAEKINELVDAHNAMTAVPVLPASAANTPAA